MYKCFDSNKKCDKMQDMDVLQRLIDKKDDDYKKFQAKLVPNISPDKILGVRTPEIRKITKEFFDSNDRDIFLSKLPHKYYEENLVHFFVISMVKDFDQCVEHIEKFLPYIDCWPVADQSSPKVFKKNHQKILPYIKKWISSQHVYTARFGIRMLMNEFLDDDFQKEYLQIVASKKGDDYYLKMMIAWFFATALAKKFDETIEYFENHKLDNWIHKKAIQKAIESYRGTDEHKEYLKTLK